MSEIWHCKGGLAIMTTTLWLRKVSLSMIRLLGCPKWCLFYPMQFEELFGHPKWCRIFSICWLTCSIYNIYIYITKFPIHWLSFIPKTQSPSAARLHGDFGDFSNPRLSHCNCLQPTRVFREAWVANLGTIAPKVVDSVASTNAVTWSGCLAWSYSLDNQSCLQLRTFLFNARVCIYTRSGATMFDPSCTPWGPHVN